MLHLQHCLGFFTSHNSYYPSAVDVAMLLLQHQHSPNHRRFCIKLLPTLLLLLEVARRREERVKYKERGAILVTEQLSASTASHVTHPCSGHFTSVSGQMWSSALPLHTTSYTIVAVSASSFSLLFDVSGSNVVLYACHLSVNTHSVQFWCWC